MNIKGKSANKHSHAGTTAVPFPGFSWEQPVAASPLLWYVPASSRYIPQQYGGEKSRPASNSSPGYKLLSNVDFSWSQQQHKCIRLQKNTSQKNRVVYFLAIFKMSST